MDKYFIATRFQEIQDDICQQLESADGEGVFKEDLWERQDGGGGRSRVIEGKHIEKGGVNFSAVHGEMPEKISAALGISSGNFFATGVSIVLHPKNPWVPIIHMNIRYFEMDNGIWWFGGGIDLTPHYINLEQASFFHHQLKAVCDQYGEEHYPKFKQWADEYFYIKHRKETRGVGGIFFDQLDGSNGFSKENRFDFTCAVGHTFCPVYITLLSKNKDIPYTEAEVAWQYLRRGRYVEFNLVWDKGTKFGLDTDGRAESILMSLPPLAAWKYDFRPDEGSKEAETLAWLKKGVNWLDVKPDIKLPSF